MVSAVHRAEEEIRMKRSAHGAERKDSKICQNRPGNVKRGRAPRRLVITHHIYGGMLAVHIQSRSILVYDDSR